MKHLIINADDFGYSKGINLGIAESHINGVLNSTTFMANMPGFNHAIELLKDIPSLAVGVHLSLTCGKPIMTKRESTLTNDKGYFHKLSDVENKRVRIDKDEVYEEWKVQINTIQSKGIDLTHIDSHHHVHSFSEYEEITGLLSKEFNLPIRNCNNNIEVNDINFVDLFNYYPIRDMNQKYMEVRSQCFKVIEDIIKENINYDKTEGMCHSAYLDSFLFENSSFNIARVREIEILCDPLMASLLNKYDIKLCNYKNI